MLWISDKYKKFLILAFPAVSFLFFITFYSKDVFFQTFLHSAIYLIWKTSCALLIILSLCGTGLAILYPRIAKREIPFPLLTGLLCGSVAVSQTLFILGLITTKGVPLFLFLLGLSFFLAYTVKHRNGIIHEISSRFQAFGRRDALEKFLFVIIIVSLLLPFLASFYPPYFSDETEYHLLNPKTFLDQGKIKGDLENPYSFFPCSFEMLYMYSMSVFDDRVPKTLHWFFHFLSIVLLYRIGTRLFSGRIGLWAAALFAVTPITAFYSSTAFITSGIIVLFLASFFFLLEYLENRAPVNVYLAAAFGSFLLTMHHSAAMLAAFLAVYLFLEARRRRMTPVIPVKTFPAILLLFLVFTGPFLMRNWWQTGDPLYPVFSTALKSSNWNSFVEYCISQQFYYTKGTGRGLLSFLLLPFSLTYSYMKFSTFDYHLGIGPIYLMLAPLFLLSAFKKQNILWPAVISSLVSLLIWFTLMPHFARFLFPLLPVFCIVGASALAGFTDNSGSKLFRKIILFSVILAAFFNMIALLQSLSTEDIARMITGQFQDDKFLRTFKGSSYEAAAYINEKTQDKTKRIGFFKKFSPYYCGLKCYSFYTSPSLSKVFMTPERIQTIRQKGFQGKNLYNCPVLSREELLQEVRKMNIAFMAFTADEYKQMRNANLDFIIEHSRLIFHYQDYLIYEIK